MQVFIKILTFIVQRQCLLHKGVGVLSLFAKWTCNVNLLYDSSVKCSWQPSVIGANVLLKEVSLFFFFIQMI